jgi:integrase
MATYQKRGSSWRAIIRRTGQKPISKSFPTKAAAIAWASQMESDILAGKSGNIPNKTFGDLLTRYSEEVSINKRGVRWEQIRIRLLQTYPIASVNLRELDARHFAEWRDKRLKEVSPASVRREWNLLSNACSVAVKEWKWLHTNALKEIKRPPAPKPRDRIISPEEIERLCHSAGYTKDVPPCTSRARVAAIMLFAIETGMRLKEMTRLTWDRVYIDKRFLHVTDDSKTGRRDVPLSKEAIRILRQLEETKDGDLVFRLTEQNVDVTFRKLREMALLEGFTFHDTKHTACTRLAKKITVFDLARIVGTRDLKTLMIYYNESAADIAAKLG